MSIAPSVQQHMPAITPSPSRRAQRLAPVSGIAAAVFFIGSVVTSSPPSSGASNAAWIANYTGSHDAEHILTGVCLVLSGLSFLLFVVTVWHRVAAATSGDSAAVSPGPLALAASSVTAACMGVGGVLMAAPSVVVQGSHQVPSPDLLRLCNGVGFTMVALPGMLAAATAVIALTVQGRRVRLFGPRMTVFGVIVAVALLAALLFLPIVLLLAWLVTVAVVLLRNVRPTPGDGARLSQTADGE